MTYAADRRLLLVHAHPDDETLTNGATMARYAAEGARVALVTCTRGEQGEILLPELAHLAADRDGGLGDHRVRELATALSALGVIEHRFLDQVPGEVHGRYQDSGMAWGPDGRAVPAPRTPPGAFSLAGVDEAAARLAVVVRQVRPQVVVTYEPGGGYGHPDHVQAHRVTMRAVELAAAEGPGGPAWPVPKVYWSVLPESVARSALADLDRRDDVPFPVAPPDGPLPTLVVPDADVTTAVDASAFVAAKTAALHAHATQVAVDGDLYALGPTGAAQPITGVEYYRLVSGTPAPPWDADGREQDLFAGL